MADSIRTKMRKGIVEGFGKMTVANGFNLDFGQVLTEPKSFEQIIGFPAVNVFFGRETYKNAAGNHAIGWIVKRIIVVLDVYLKVVENMPLQRSKVLADIEKQFMTEFFLPDSGGIGTVIETRMLSNEPWGLESNKTYGGMTVTLQIDYNQNIVDPTLNTPGVRPVISGDNPASTPVSVRENIRNAIIFNLQQITVANGFDADVFTDEDILSHEQIIEYPFVNVVSKAESYLNAGDSTLHDIRLRKTASYDMDCYIRSIDDPNDSIEKILADIEKRFMLNYNLQDSSGKRTAVECMFTFNEKFGIETNKPLHGISIGLDVFYRQDLNDPTVPT